MAVLVREREPSSDRPVVAVDERQSLTALLTVGAGDTVREGQDCDGDPGARVLVDQPENIADRVGVAKTERAPSVLRLLRRRDTDGRQLLPLFADEGAQREEVLDDAGALALSLVQDALLDAGRPHRENRLVVRHELVQRET